MFALQIRCPAGAIAILCILSISGCGAPDLEVPSEQANTTPSNENPSKVADSPSEQTESPLDATNGSETGTKDLQQVFEVWESGAKDDAVNMLVQVDWEDTAVIDSIPVMAISEQEFMTQSTDVKSASQAEAMKLSSDSKALTRHAFALGEQAEASGDSTKAKQYYEAVRRLGSVLAEPERLAVLKIMGNSLINMANEKLSVQN